MHLGDGVQVEVVVRERPRRTAFHDERQAAVLGDAIEHLRPRGRLEIEADAAIVVGTLRGFLSLREARPEPPAASSPAASRPLEPWPGAAPTRRHNPSAVFQAVRPALRRSLAITFAPVSRGILDKIRSDSPSQFGESALSLLSANST